MNGEITSGGLCERRGGGGLLAVAPPPSLAEPLEALNRAYHAWVRTQPQLILDLWDEAGLDEQDEGASVLLVEPAIDSPLCFPGGGLTASGTEPRRDPELTANQLVTSEHPFLTNRVVVGAALSTTTEAGAQHIPVRRARLQSGD